MSVQGHTGPRWEDKIPKAFFRGRDSRQERLDLVKNHRNNTDMFDVGLTNFFFFDYDEQLYGPKHKAISFFDFFKVNAYQIPPGTLHVTFISPVMVEHHQVGNMP